MHNFSVRLKLYQNNNKKTKTVRTRGRGELKRFGLQSWDIDPESYSQVGLSISALRVTRADLRSTLALLLTSGPVVQGLKA